MAENIPNKTNGTKTNGVKSLIEDLTTEEIRRKHLQSLLRHIKLVQDATQLLGERMIEKGESEFGRILISNGLLHDNSKLTGIEWQFLLRGESNGNIKWAIEQHWTSNQHHPEFWGGISEMPRIYLAEMVCDCYARSTEQGTDLRKWIKETAAEKFGFSIQGKVYKQIKEFVDLLLDMPFGKIGKIEQI